MLTTALSATNAKIAVSKVVSVAGDSSEDNDDDEDDDDDDDDEVEQTPSRKPPARYDFFFHSFLKLPH